MADSRYRPVPLTFDRLPADAQRARAREFLARIATRRTVRHYGVEHDASGAERHVRHYYVSESVGIACGFLLAALHWAGVATLTHTPSPMGFLAKILARPTNEKPYLLIPVGYPAPDAEGPDIQKKKIEDVRIDV